MEIKKKKKIMHKKTEFYQRIVEKSNLHHSYVLPTLAEDLQYLQENMWSILQGKEIEKVLFDKMFEIS